MPSTTSDRPPSRDDDRPDAGASDPRPGSDELAATTRPDDAAAFGEAAFPGKAQARVDAATSNGVRREPGAAARAARSPGRHVRPPEHPVRNRILVVLGLLLAVPALFFVFSVVGALRTPGNYSFKAKWADWLRSHHSELVVREFENVYFKTKEAKKGGTVKQLHDLPGVDPTSNPGTSHGPTVTLPPHLAKPTPVPLVVKPAVAGEGQWVPTGPLTHGLAGMYYSQFRADDIYTSQITSAVWIDPKLMRIRLVPGAQEPGGTWDIPHDIEGGALDKIAAAFNGGFRFQDAHGGFYLDGREAVGLVDGAASMVVYKDGHIDIGAWNREVHMSSDVEGVLQNLTLMVDGGKLDEQISHNDTSSWGSTLGGSIAVARSGIGVTKTGALVYVAGPSLTAKSLAESLERAGAVRAMTLDINPEWVTFIFFQHPDPAKPGLVKGTKLYPEIQRSEDRYLSTESRDFFTISQR